LQYSRDPLAVGAALRYFDCELTFRETNEMSL